MERLIPTISIARIITVGLALVVESFLQYPQHPLFEVGKLVLAFRPGGPTGVGHGVALPHARLDDLEELCGVFVMLEKPVDFSAPDREPVDIVFSLFAPADAGVEHLKALALISRTLKDSGVRTKLRSNDDPSALYAILTAGPTSQAA